MAADSIKIIVKREMNSSNPFEDGKFAEKMTHQQRCFALCLYIKGEGWRRIAAYFGAHYRTIQMIKTGPRYKPVRSEFQKLGQEDFLAKYLTETELANYNKWKADHEEEASHGRQCDDPNAPGWSPVKGATSSAGQHQKTSTVDGSTVFFDITWRDTNDAKRPGWYVAHKDGEDGPFGTSNRAYDASKRYWDPPPVPVELAVDAEAKEAAQLFEAAKNARVEMEANPSALTVTGFIHAAFNVYRFVDRSEGLLISDARNMLRRIDWKGFDPAPFGVYVDGMKVGHNEA